jgi:hypothetical protein
MPRGQFGRLGWERSMNNAMEIVTFGLLVAIVLIPTLRRWLSKLSD